MRRLPHPTGGFSMPTGHGNERPAGGKYTTLRACITRPYGRVFLFGNILIYTRDKKGDNKKSLNHRDFRSRYRGSSATISW